MFKQIDLAVLESIWVEAKTNKEKFLAKHNHEGWTEFVNEFCDAEPGEQIAPGVFVTSNYSFAEFYLTKEFEDFPERTLADKDGKDPLVWFIEGNCYCSYGLCDSPEQFLESEIYKFYHARPEEFVASLFERRKGDGGGWRWHKEGPYIGTYNREHEFFNDEVGIDRVFSFRIALKK